MRTVDAAISRPLLFTPGFSIVPNTNWKLRKIISGGQTGVDQVALEVAKHIGYETGGWMSFGYRTEDGPRPDLAEMYGLQTCDSDRYDVRTVQNVRQSDLTVWFGFTDTPGYVCTRNATIVRRRHLLINPTINILCNAITFEGVEVLNVAGNRVSVNPAAATLAQQVLLLLPCR